MHPIIPSALRVPGEVELNLQCRSRRLIARYFWLGVVMCVAAAGGARADQIDDFVAVQMRRQHVPGLSLAVMKNGKPVKVQGYGVESLELGTRAMPETVYQIGSLSKQFIAAGIMLLSRQGKLDLDDSITKYLGDAPEAWRAIKIRHVLTHTSGLVRETAGLQLKAQSAMDAIQAAYATPLSFEPGEKWQYSNLGYFVLAEIISRTAQMPWPQYLEERIFTPLGMSATRTTTVEELVPRRASGYHWMDDEKYRNAQIVPGVRPSGAFLSSVLDLAKWDAALYSDELLSPQERKLMWTAVKLNDGSEKPYGFGWELATFGGHSAVKHAGTMLGFRSQMLRFSDDGLTIIVLTNATQALPEKVALGVAAFYLPELKVQQPERKSAVLSPQVLDGHVGRYQLAGGRVLSVARRDDKLSLSMTMATQALGPEIAALLQGLSMEIALLTPENESRFFDGDDPRSTYIFSMDAQGRTQLRVENDKGQVIQTASRLSASN